jgi:Fe-S-cluster containining protein
LRLVERLRFACTGCGRCCAGRGHYVVEADRAEQRRIQAFLGITWRWFRRRYVFRFDDETESLRVADGRCGFLDDANRCRIYAVRPRQCRTYPFWPELMSATAWRAEARRCEGIGRGGVVPLSRVRAQLKLAQSSSVET